MPSPRHSNSPKPPPIAAKPYSPTSSAAKPSTAWTASPKPAAISTLALDGARQIGAVEEQWTAQYGLGRVYRRNGEDARALETLRQAIAGIESVRTALGTASLKAEFLANKRDVYDAAIDILLQTAAATPAQLFDLIERARSRNLQDALRDRMSLPTLPELQRRLDPHSLLIEYWIAPGRVAALWICPGRQRRRHPDPDHRRHQLPSANSPPPCPRLAIPRGAPRLRKSVSSCSPAFPLAPPSPNS